MPQPVQVDSYHLSPDRFATMPHVNCGSHGLLLPRISLGLWQNFGDDRSFNQGRAVVRRAVDLGVTHLDLANNYGPPPGMAERNLGRLLRTDFAGHRDELIISTKAGYAMWPGPHGSGGSRKHLLASLDQSLKRLGCDYVDIFYSHRADPTVPLEETLGALASAVSSGRALYVGLSSYSATRTLQAHNLASQIGLPLLIHQPSYSLFNRWIEQGSPSLLEVVDKLGMGLIAFSPLGQGLLTDKYLNALPPNSRAAADRTFAKSFLTDQTRRSLHGLHEIAQQRGQTLAQMAIAWVLKDSRVSSALIGASRLEQLESNLKALDNLEFSPAELAAIEQHSFDAGINIWSASSAVP
ncbi:MAG: L-glyceraldehyde 3-phosphate reductase [Bifidobacteriaceae bacterium]|jgi:L-glyceraldehyde 3-phosphate reductase|nr:L-glyceraldehyde 3-phosphate reductase [Bifidobacteriaceae bacterium]